GESVGWCPMHRGLTVSDRVACAAVRRAGKGQGHSGSGRQNVVTRGATFPIPGEEARPLPVSPGSRRRARLPRALSRDGGAPPRPGRVERGSQTLKGGREEGGAQAL